MGYSERQFAQLQNNIKFSGIEHQPEPEEHLQSHCEHWLKLKKTVYLHLTTFLKLQCYECDSWINISVPGNKGITDLIIFLRNGITLFVELKSKEGKLFKEQKEFRDKILGLGFEHHVIRKFEDLQTLVNKKLRCSGQ